jgi:hypothetical protein
LTTTLPGFVCSSGGWIWWERIACNHLFGGGGSGRRGGWNEKNDKVERENRDGDGSGGGGYDNNLDEPNRHPRHLHPETTIKLKNGEDKDNDDKEDDEKKNVDDEDDGRQHWKRQEEGAAGWFIVRQLRLPMKNRKDVVFFLSTNFF